MMFKPSDIGAAIFDKLRADYLTKIGYGKDFCVMVAEDPIMREHGYREDHVAFRTFYCDTGAIPKGIESVERIFRACGWTRGRDEKGQDYTYDFPHMFVEAIHVEPPAERPDLPKIFISQLMVDQLDEKDRTLIINDLKDTADPLTDEDRAMLKTMEKGGDVPADYATGLVERCFKALSRPWLPPHRRTVLEADQRSQYAAWTLLNGGVNHFAYLTGDLEKTAAAHEAAGRELLPKVMGSKEVGLLQTSVRSPIFEFNVRDTLTGETSDGFQIALEVREDDDSFGKILWTGPFMEIIERPLGEDGTRRENFLAENAAHIFAATKNRETKKNKLH